MADNDRTNGETPDFRGYIINENGEEVPITEEMVAESMAEAKLKSIGAHTGYTKAVTDEMLRDHEEMLRDHQDKLRHSDDKDQ